MKFNGTVQDLGSVGQGTTYEMGYSGEDLEGLKQFVLSEVRRKGVVVVGEMTQSEKDGRWTVGVRVRSERGIV